MNTDQFWEIIERVNQASDGTAKQKCEILTGELKTLSPEEMQSFLLNEGRFYYEAYNWELWIAADLIFGGCGDDSFMDFRSSLVFMGRRIFEAAMRNPDSLAEYDFNARDHRSQSYSMALSNAIKWHGIGEGLPANVPRHPKEPSGTHYQVWELEKRFPRLTAKHGHKDAEHLWEKERWERRNRKLSYTLAEGSRQTETQGSLAELLLDARIIRDSGWIPPFKVIARILKEREFTDGKQRCFWNAFEYNEGDYWQTVSEVEKEESNPNSPSAAVAHPTEKADNVIAKTKKSAVEHPGDCDQGDWQFIRATQSNKTGNKARYCNDEQGLWNERNLVEIHF